MLTVSVPIPG